MGPDFGCWTVESCPANVFTQIRPAAQAAWLVLCWLKCFVNHQSGV
jgi:hypothetical protein